VYMEAVVDGMIFQLGYITGHVYYGHAHQATGGQ
jgi:hypothetical protein